MDKKSGILKKICLVIATIFFIFVAAFIIYCKIGEQVFYKKGAKYAPEFSIYTVVSPSMRPNYRVYDIVVNRKIDAAEIDEGDVITFISSNMDYPGITMTHRVIGFTKDEHNRTCFITKGDNNPSKDQACARGNKVIGKVIFRIPFLGFIGSKYGILFFILVVISSVFLKKVKKESMHKR